MSQNFKIIDQIKDKKTVLKKMNVYPMWTDVSTDNNSLNDGIMSTFYTSSIQSGSFNSNYYLSVYNSNINTNVDSVIQFDIAYGTSNILQLNVNDDDLKYIYPSTAIYDQFANMLLPDGQTEFSVDSNATFITSSYIISISKDLIKSSVAKGNWQLTLSGSGTCSLNLGDSSDNITTYNSDMYYIIPKEQSVYTGRPNSMSTTAISASAAASEKLGLFYPKQGIMILNADRINTLMSNDISAWKNSVSVTPQPIIGSMYNMMSRGSYFKAFANENIASTYYFINVKHDEFNYSNNPTWRDPENGLVLAEFQDEPATFITGIGLTNNLGVVLAVAKVSKPILKNPETELTIQVRIDY